MENNEVLNDAKVTVFKDGPYMVEGKIKVERNSGELIKEGTKFFLCRCGNSKNKPFCDGSHKKVGFKAD